MIVIFGGTTEGRVAAEVCDKAAKSYIYSTKGEEQKLLANYAQRLYGAMTSDAMVSLFEGENARLIIDAAHPYATELHKNIAQSAARCNIPVIRFERLSTNVTAPYNTLRFNSLSDIIEHIQDSKIQNILALTGVKSAAALAPIARDHRVTLRIMDRELSHQEVERSGFPEEQIVYYDLSSSTELQNNLELCKDLNIQAIITKDSGRSGGFETKVALAQKLNTPLFIINRPPLPHSTATVYGEFGLRRAIEELLPDFFTLRTGFTTGSAATAATLAAAMTIVDGVQRESVQIYLPNGEPITIPVSKFSQRDGYAEYEVVKYGGDDPDATDGIEIRAEVKIDKAGADQITIDGGEGVGRVTLPGVGIEVGQAAINPVPRQMIVDNISRMQIKGGVEIKISVPQGESIGAKTFNPRLGIIGGISILGTSGIVQPFSSEAFMESIQRQIHIVKALGHNTIAINSGAMSERYIKGYIAELPQPCYIHYGNLIGATIELAASEGIKHLCIGCMIGKAVKLAKGALDTHSKSTILDRDFLLQLATDASCSESTKAAITEITTARELWSVTPQCDNQLFQLIAQRCFDHCKPLFPAGELELLLISDDGDIRAIVKG